jgi:hypothetical protein
MEDDRREEHNVDTPTKRPKTGTKQGQFVWNGLRGLYWATTAPDLARPRHMPRNFSWAK